MITEFGTSPFIYPIYGLGTLSEAFLRKVVLNQGKIKLKTHISEFMTSKNKITGVKTINGQSYSAPIVICDPTYAYNCGYKDHVYVK